jgi:hypothetical protein
MTTIKGLSKKELFNRYITAFSEKQFYRLINEILPEKKGKKLLTAREVSIIIEEIGYWEIPVDDLQPV